jgi:ADP-ribose pyrophosphatase YjhB (NUDIX family)
MFHLSLQQLPDVRLNEENEAFYWAASHEFETLPLIAGGRAAYFRYCQMMPTKRKPIALVSAYLILQQGDRILLGLRQNTGYSDGMWSFPAGHVEEGEPASKGMIREAYEELGIRLDPDHLKAVHVMHRQSNRLVVDIFFHCAKWEGEIENREPQKCKALAFFSLNALPSPLVGYNLEALKAFKEGRFYSEMGWIS